MVTLRRMVSMESGGKRIRIGVNQRVNIERDRDSMYNSYFKDVLLRQGQRNRAVGGGAWNGSRRWEILEYVPVVMGMTQ